MFKVLIADDETLVIDSLKYGIQWEEYNCQVAGEASDGDEALEKILKIVPDIVFIDIRMPGMSGLDVIQRANEKLGRTQFVVVSGYSEFEYAKKAIDFGVIGYCLKPFDEEEIVRMLKKAIKVVEDGEKALLRMNPKSDIEKVKNNTFKAILIHISENYIKSPITVQDLSQKFSMNQSYLSQLFKKELNTTFTDYINKLKIARALELLADPSLNINEVAEKSGYSDYFYFAHIFKKLVGKTPTQYRNGLNNNIDNI